MEKKTKVVDWNDVGPELLEAAKAVREWAEYQGGWDAKCWRELNAAVAKAEGREG
jgi:enterochelin esterase-like enzyme